MKLYKVKVFEKTISVVLVEASNKDEAIEIAKMSHVDIGHGELLDSSWRAERLSETPVGRIINTKDGYKDADGKIHKNY